MIPISRNTWHYKLIKQYFGKPSNEFCNYFWSLLWSTTRKLYLWIIPLIILYIIGGFLFITELLGINLKYKIIISENVFIAIPQIIIASISGIFFVISTFVFMIIIYSISIEYSTHTRFLKNISNYFTNTFTKIFDTIIETFYLIYQFIITQKKKICPTIKFIK